MLRDYVYTLNPTLIADVFRQFDTDVPHEEATIALVAFNVITPDSFLWKFVIEDVVYYLYAEDAVKSLADIEGKILKNMTVPSDMEFVPVKLPKDFTETGPYIAASVYETPEDVETVMEYAADAGFDFAFLVRTEEDSADAYFKRIY